MSDSKVVHLDVVVAKEDAEAGVFEIISRLRPQWKREEIILKNFSEGFVNHMLCCHLESDVNKKDAIVIRSFGSFDSSFKFDMDRDYEMMALQVATSIKVAQPVYAVFRNGVAYRFAPGRTLTGEDVRNPDVIRLACEASARLTCADLTRIPVLTSGGEEKTLDTRDSPILTTMMTAMFSMIPESFTDPEVDERFKKELLPKGELIALFNRMKDHMDRYVPKVFSHNDFHIKNIVYDPDNGQLSVLDYEMMGNNYEGFDLTRLFALAPFWEFIGWCKSDHFEVSDLKTVSREYLKEKYRLQGKNTETITESEVAKVFWCFKMNWIFSEFMMVPIWLGLVENKMSEKMDFRHRNTLQFAIDMYKKNKVDHEYFFNSTKPERRDLS